MSDALRISRLDAFVFRAPIEAPVVTSFGTMRDRPMTLVRVTDADGVAGWGEIWCNFPTVGAEHRARLATSVLAPILEGRTFASAGEAFDTLTARTAVLAIQCAEPGPIAQAIAGVDIALWDLLGRRRKQPLWRLLGGQSPRVPVYASGLNPDGPERLAAARLADGYRAFKLKIGFGAERDLANLKALRTVVGDLPLMVDANQAWDLATATDMARRIEPFGLGWLEEPLRADQPWSDWQALARASTTPLAGGENMMGHETFDAALASGAFGVIQPDMAKWGGFSAGLPVARRILASGRRYCPHYLGGGIGLAASAHLLAAAGGGGLLEVDANPNPLRERACGAAADVREGYITLDEAPGLGIEFDPEAFARFAVRL